MVSSRAPALSKMATSPDLNGLHDLQAPEFVFLFRIPGSKLNLFLSKEQGKDGQHAIGASYLKASNHMVVL